mmetsp:Transcript_3218/g.6716  ORF Transcript_3218/g.6716 Transcript_3218/m.6716 type:complete len:209 (-) Transcript_3218:271-897(-)
MPACAVAPMVSTAKDPSWATSTVRSAAFVNFAQWGSSTVTSSSPSSLLRTEYDGVGHNAAGVEFIAAAAFRAVSSSLPTECGGGSPAFVLNTGSDSPSVTLSSHCFASNSPCAFVSARPLQGPLIRVSAESPLPSQLVGDENLCVASTSSASESPLADTLVCVVLVGTTTVWLERLSPYVCSKRASSGHRSFIMSCASLNLFRSPWAK